MLEQYPQPTSGKIPYNRKHTKKDVREHFEYSNIPVRYQGRKRIMWVGPKNPTSTELQASRAAVELARKRYPDTGFTILAEGDELPVEKRTLREHQEITRKRR